MFPLQRHFLAAGVLVICTWLTDPVALQALDNPVTLVAGTGGRGSAGDGGPAVQATFDNPFGITRGPDANLYVVEFEGNVVRRIDANGVITRVAGSGRKGGAGDGGTALDAEFNQPHEIRFDRAGNLYLSDMLNHRIRKVDAVTRMVSTVAGTGSPGFGGDGGAAIQAALNHPIAIQFDASGDLFICDIGNHRIRRVQMKTGVIETFAGTGQKLPTPDGSPFATAPLHGPRTLDFDASGNLWVALREGNQIWRLNRSNGQAQLIAGTGKTGFKGNGGPGREAAFSGPKGLAIAPDGKVYIADTENHTIRRIDPATGKVEAFVGDGVRGDGVGGKGADCRLARPHGVYVDRDGSVYIGDSENHRVKRATP